MDKKFYIAANWKMNGSLSFIEEYFDSIKSLDVIEKKPLVGFGYISKSETLFKVGLPTKLSANETKTGRNIKAPSKIVLVQLDPIL